MVFSGKQQVFLLASSWARHSGGLPEANIPKELVQKAMFLAGDRLVPSVWGEAAEEQRDHHFRNPQVIHKHGKLMKDISARSFAVWSMAGFRNFLGSGLLGYHLDALGCSWVNDGEFNSPPFLGDPLPVLRCTSSLLTQHILDVAASLYPTRVALCGEECFAWRGQLGTRKLVWGG